MKPKKIIVYMALTAVLVGVGQTVAVEHSLYWNIWWFDIPMHFLGGLWVALIALWFYKTFAGDNASSNKGYLVALTATIIVGLLWELFEIVMGLTVSQPNYEADTILDLIMDVTGAIVATRIVFRQVVTNHHIK